MLKKFRKKQWRLYLYYNGVLIKKIWIHEQEAPSQNSYVVRIWGKKNIFGSNIATVILKPVELLKNDEKHLKTHWGTIHERGVEF